MPNLKASEQDWKLPEPLDMGGDFLTPPEEIRAEVEAIEYKALRALSGDAEAGK